MKKFIIRALQSLRMLLDPSLEGSPYETDPVVPTYKPHKSYRSYQFNRRYVLPRT